MHHTGGSLHRTSKSLASSVGMMPQGSTGAKSTTKRKFSLMSWPRKVSRLPVMVTHSMAFFLGHRSFSSSSASNSRKTTCSSGPSRHRSPLLKRVVVAEHYQRESSEDQKPPKQVTLVNMVPLGYLPLSQSSANANLLQQSSLSASDMSSSVVAKVRPQHK